MGFLSSTHRDQTSDAHIRASGSKSYLFHLKQHIISPLSPPSDDWRWRSLWPGFDGCTCPAVLCDIPESLWGFRKAWMKRELWGRGTSHQYDHSLCKNVTYEHVLWHFYIWRRIKNIWMKTAVVLIIHKESCSFRERYVSYLISVALWLNWFHEHNTRRKGEVSGDD